MCTHRLRWAVCILFKNSSQRENGSTVPAGCAVAHTFSQQRDRVHVVSQRAPFRSFCPRRGLYRFSASDISGPSNTLTTIVTTPTISRWPSLWPLDFLPFSSFATSIHLECPRYCNSELVNFYLQTLEPHETRRGSCALAYTNDKTDNPLNEKKLHSPNDHNHFLPQYSITP